MTSQTKRLRYSIVRRFHLRPASWCAVAGLVLGGLVHSNEVGAQPFPQRPIKIVGQAAPGGGTDILSRLVATEMEKDLGQPVIVENKPGGSGAVATTYAISQPPDGYTILFVPVGTISILPAVETALAYDPARDLVPISRVFDANLLINARADFPADDLKQLAAMAKAKPGQFTYGHSGSFGMPHIGMELFKGQAGVDVLAVPFRGEAPALVALLGKQTDLSTITYSALSSHLKEGKVKVLAQLGASRSPALPNVPTAAESGFPGVVASSWVGMFAPAKTPPEIVQKLADAIAKAVRTPAVRDKMIAQDQIPVGDQPAAFAAFVRAESERWKKVIEDQKLKALPK